MESLFSHRPFRKRRLFICGVVAILMEASLVVAAQIWTIPRSWTIPETVTQLDTGPVLGESVQELIAPKEEPVPTPDMPTPPPEDTPPPDDTPPPTDDPDMESPPPKKEPPKPRTGTPYPANVKRGDHPQAGVVGGVPHAEKTTGTPGYAALGGVGVHHPKPPYPYQARAARLQGSGSVRVSFDSSGRCSSCTIVQSVGSGVLDSNTVNFARANWTGPPNSTTIVPITYQLN